MTLKTNGVAMATTVTDSSGNYSFTNLPPGSYTIAETDPSGYLSTGDTQAAMTTRLPSR